jgi:sulfatase modifying factor 1
MLQRLWWRPTRKRLVNFKRFMFMAAVAAGCSETGSWSAEPATAQKPAASAGVKIFTNSVGMALVKIPAGEFMMGNLESDADLKKAFPLYDPERIEKLADERPAHKVRIRRPFYLDVHEVTIGEFKQFVAGAHYQTESERDGTGGWGYQPKIQYFEGRKPEYSWRNPGFKQLDSHPVVNVSWNDAVAFCDWLSRKEHKTYRLPTEAEWEYACRARTTTRFSVGDDPESLVKVANLYDLRTKKLFPQWEKYAVAGSDGFEFTAPAGSFQPNKFGLYDMHGNVWEWCSDWYSEDYYAHSPIDDPQGPAEGELKVRRGGSWHSWPLYMRSSFRNWNTPETRYVLLGFRVALNDF